MPAAPPPKNEAERLAALRQVGLLDSGGDLAFDAFAELASAVCETPFAFISIVDDERQWFKSNVGFPGVSETPREVAFCAYALESTDLLEVPDATLDVRFADNPFVTGEPGIRFYAGTPLVDRNGYVLGTLCVVDLHVRTLRTDQRATLQLLGSALSSLIETRRGIAPESLEQVAMISAGLELAAVPIAVLRLGEGGETTKIVYVNRAFCELFAYDAPYLIGQSPNVVQGPLTDSIKMARLRADVAAGSDASETVYLYTAVGEARLVEIRDRPIDARHRIVSLRDLTHLHATQRALRVSTARAQSLVDNNGDAVFTLDSSGRCLDANAAATTIFGYDRATFATRGLSDIDEDGRERVDAVTDSLCAKRMVTFVANWRARNGEDINVEAKVVPMSDGQTIEGAFLIVRDVTERTRLATSVEEHAKRIAALYHISAQRGSSYGLQIDAALELVVAAFGMDYGYVGEIVGDAFRVCNGVGDPIVPTGSVVPLAQTYVREALAHGDAIAIDDINDWTGGDELVRKYAGWHGYISAPLVVDGTAIGAIGFIARKPVRFGAFDLDFIRLVSTLVAAAWERRLRDERLERLAHVDTLTGLANRAAFVAAIEEAIVRARAQGGSLAVHFIDLDGFKGVNDSAGHAIGDLALVEVARRIRTSLRDAADMPARLGGDEFVVIQASIGSVADAEALGDRLVDALAKPYVLAGPQISLSASIGIAIFPDDGIDASTLLRRADEALYRAKTGGKRRVELSRT